MASGPSELVSLFDVDILGENLPGPSWNIAPTQPVAIVLDTIVREQPEGEPVRRLVAARWGLVPSWADDLSVGVRAVNARIETAAEKPTFRDAVAARRAVIPATGYYEWKTVDGVKTPYFIHLPDGELMIFAALYEWWRNPAAAADSPDRWVLSTAILTRDAPGELATIHDRMPVLVAPELIDEWLDPHTDGSPELLEAIAESTEDVAASAQFHEVDRAVGTVANNGPHLTEAVGS